MALPANADIALCLVELGHTENCAPDLSSYATLAAGWRGTGECPSEASMETAWATVNGDKQMAKMRAERDARLAAIEWRVTRNRGQINGSLTQTDDAAKMAEIYQYMQDLRDMPQDNPSVADDAAYDALTWPSEPA